MFEARPLKSPKLPITEAAPIFQRSGFLHNFQAAVSNKQRHPIKAVHSGIRLEPNILNVEKLSIRSNFIKTYVFRELQT